MAGRIIRPAGRIKVKAHTRKAPKRSKAKAKPAKRSKPKAKPRKGGRKGKRQGSLF